MTTIRKKTFSVVIGGDSLQGPNTPRYFPGYSWECSDQKLPWWRTPLIEPQNMYDRGLNCGLDHSPWVISAHEWRTFLTYWWYCTHLKSSPTTLHFTEKVRQKLWWASPCCVFTCNYSKLWGRAELKKRVHSQSTLCEIIKQKIKTKPQQLSQLDTNISLWSNNTSF